MKNTRKIVPPSRVGNKVQNAPKSDEEFVSFANDEDRANYPNDANGEMETDGEKSNDSVAKKTENPRTEKIGNRNPAQANLDFANREASAEINRPQKNLANDEATTPQKFREEIATLARRLSELKNELENRRIAFEHQLEIAVSARDAALAERKKARAQHAEELRCAENEIAQWKQKQESVVAQRQELRAALDLAKREQKTKLHNLRDEADTEAALAREEIERLTTDCEELGKQIAFLKQECDGAKKEEASLRESADLLVQERDSALVQLRQSQSALKKETELFEHKRKLLIEERETALAAAEQARGFAGKNRADLLKDNAALSQQLETLRAEHRGILDQLALANGETEQRESRSQQEKERLGAAQSQRYEMLEELANSETTLTSKARDHFANREVTLHQLTPEAAQNPDFTAHFLEGVRLIARLQHPAIPPVYDVGLLADGTPFYTTKLFDGITLRQIIDELERGETGTLIHYSVRRLLSILQRVCDAVAYAHAMEIRHGHLATKQILIGHAGAVYVTGWELETAPIFGENRRPKVLDEHPDIAALGEMLEAILTRNAPPPGVSFSPFASGKKQKSANHHRLHDTEFSSLMAIAKRAVRRNAQDSYLAVKDFQREIDLFRDGFDDPEDRNSIFSFFEIAAKAHPAQFILIIILLALLLAWLFLLRH